MSNSVTLDISHILWFVGLLSAVFGTMLKVLVGQVEKRLDEKFAAMENKFTDINHKFAKSELADADNKLEAARIERDLMGMRIELAEKYVKAETISSLRAELQEVRREISSGQEKIMNKLDTKVSKDECGACRP